MAKVADVMVREVETVSPLATVQEAAERMKAANVGSIPICVDSRLVGTLTDRDITIRVTAEGRDPQTTPVRDVMSQPMVTVLPQQDLADAEQLMHDYQVRRIPVVEQDLRLVGYVTTATIAKRDGDEKTVGNVLRGIAQPKKPAPEMISPSRVRGGKSGA